MICSIAGILLLLLWLSKMTQIEIDLVRCRDALLRFSLVWQVYQLFWVLIMGWQSDKSVLFSYRHRLFKQLVQWLSLAHNLSILPWLSYPMIHYFCLHMLFSGSNDWWWPQFMITTNRIATHWVPFRTLANLCPSISTIAEKHRWLSLLRHRAGLIRIIVSSGAWLARSARVILRWNQVNQRQRTILHLFGGHEDLFRRWPCRQHIEHDFLTVNSSVIVIIRACLVEQRMGRLHWHLFHSGWWWWSWGTSSLVNSYWWSWLVSWMRRVLFDDWISVAATLLRWTLIVFMMSFLKSTSFLHLLFKHVYHHALDLLWLLTDNVSGHQLGSWLRHIPLIEIYRC